MKNLKLLIFCISLLTSSFALSYGEYSGRPAYNPSIIKKKRYKKIKRFIIKKSSIGNYKCSKTRNLIDPVTKRHLKSFENLDICRKALSPICEREGLILVNSKCRQPRKVYQGARDFEEDDDDDDEFTRKQAYVKVYLIRNNRCRGKKIPLKKLRRYKKSRSPYFKTIHRCRAALKR